MMNECQKFSYKNFSGTLGRLEDGTFTGKVLELNRNNTYHAYSIKELEKQFKNRVDYFYESCAMLGVDPEPLGSGKPSKVPYLVLFFSAVFVMGFLWWFYTSAFPLDNITSTNKVHVEWFDKSGSFFNNFSAPILSFFSFMGLLFTIYQQNKSHRLSLKELALTREELELTRKEIEKTTIANEEQAEALRQQVHEAKSAAAEQKALATEQRLATQIQQFESSFYALLSEHNKALGELVAENKTLKINSFGEMRCEDALKRIRGDAQLSTYFRMLYQLLKFVATSNVENHSRDFSNEYLGSPVPDVEKRYASLVRSMLPNSVLGWLSVNCIEGVGSEHLYNKYFLLIERYAFLEHLNLRGRLFFLYTNSISRRVEEYPSVLCSVLQTYTSNGAFGTNESLFTMEGEMRSILKGHDNNSVFKTSELSKGRDGSACSELIRGLKDLEDD
ncbi:TPA: putative phage abortive infection protein [Vibrio alginolyticus]